MAQIVELSNGQKLEFPDGMSDDQMHEAIQRNYPMDKFKQDEQVAPQKQMSYREQLGKGIQDAVKGGGIGLFQGLSDIGANIAQVPSDIYSMATGREGYKAPKPDFRSFMPQSTTGKISGTIGEYAAPFLAPGAIAESLGSKALSKLLIGSGVGAAESENRLLGGALGGASGLVPAAAKLINSSTSKNIAKTLTQDKAAIKKAYTKQYGDLFKEAAEKGISDVAKPRINTKVIEDSGMPKYYKALKQFQENPSLENAHWAQSGLGQLERKLDKVAETMGLTPPQNKAYREVQSAKKKIQEAMFAQHKLGSQPELAKLYENISKGYKNEVVPWNSAKGLEDFGRGELKAKDLTKKLANNKKFMAQLGDQFPQIKINKAIRSPFFSTALAAALGLEGVHKLYGAVK